VRRIKIRKGPLSYPSHRKTEKKEKRGKFVVSPVRAVSIREPDHRKRLTTAANRSVSNNTDVKLLKSLACLYRGNDYPSHGLIPVAGLGYLFIGTPQVIAKPIPSLSAEYQAKNGPVAVWISGGIILTHDGYPERNW